MQKPFYLFCCYKHNILFILVSFSKRLNRLWFHQLNIVWIQRKPWKMEKKKKISLVGSQQPTQSSMTQHEPKKQESKWYQEKDFWGYWHGF